MTKKRPVTGPYAVEKKKHYKIDESTGCWNWLMAKDKDGYGRYTPYSPRHSASQKPAHRYYYELLIGPVPDGLILDHTCKNKGCVNPDHLEPVTYAESAYRTSNTKLTKDMVAAIRQLLENTTLSQQAIASQFGVSQPQISRILNNKRRKKG